MRQTDGQNDGHENRQTNTHGEGEKKKIYTNFRLLHVQKVMTHYIYSTFLYELGQNFLDVDTLL